MKFRRVSLMVVGLVVVLFSLMAADVSLAATTSPDGPRGVILTDLGAKAKLEGSVRVIARLNMRSRREGDLPTAQAVAAQRQSIQAVQSAVLSELAATSFSVTSRFSTIPFLALEVSGDSLAALERSSLIVDVQEDRINTVSLGNSIPVINADDVWALGIDGSGIAVAILDTGVDSGHPFLAGKVKAEACFTAFGSCPDGSNEQIGPGSGAPCPGCFHGTHVAGIAAGKGTNSGVAKEADLIAIQVFSSIPGGGLGAFDSDIIDGLEHVLSLNATMTIASANMSLGGGVFASQAACDAANVATKAAIDNLRSVDIATVIASGNEGNKGAISSPGCISSAVSVGATNNSDVVASFSNSVSFLNLLAPGVSIVSSVPGGGFGTLSGTSMATPHVAGAWALMLDKFPGASVDFILSALSTNGVPVKDVKNGIVKPRIDVLAALAGPNTECTTELSLSYSGGNLTMNITIGTLAPAKLNIYLAALNFVFPIATEIPIPIISPPITVPVVIPMPPLGGVGGLVTMTTPSGGIICADWDFVNTGSSLSKGVGALRELRNSLQSLEGIPLSK